MFSSLSAGEDYSLLYKIEKGNKKLGNYSLVLNSKKITSKSSGVSNRLEIFSSKEISYIGSDIRKITFRKNKQIKKYTIITNKNAFNEELSKQYRRDLKKVKGQEMLFMIKEGDKGLELFNKRPTIIKTIDEVLADIYNSNLKYKKFILFDKLGVMKMIAKIKKIQDGFLIENALKKKAYIKITTKNKLPLKIKSMVSDWQAILVLNGSVSREKVDFSEFLVGMFNQKLNSVTNNLEVSLESMKKTNSFYDYKGEVNFLLLSSLQGRKAYQQKEICKGYLKKLKVKTQKLKVKDGFCNASIRSKVNIKEIKRDLLTFLSEKHPQLKISKNIYFNKNNITYEVIK